MYLLLVSAIGHLFVVAKTLRCCKAMVLALFVTLYYKADFPNNAGLYGPVERTPALLWIWPEN
jgi:hypothetical protein